MALWCWINSLKRVLERFHALSIQYAMLVSHNLHHRECYLPVYTKIFIHTIDVCARLNTLIQMENNHLALKMARIN